jgi:hypothetical protein
MRAARRSLFSFSATLAVVTLMLPGASGALAQSAQADPGVVSDDMLTLVIGTRFVTASRDDDTPRAQFNGARIPLSAFNETDRCVDQQALEVAKEYFTTLGRMLGKAGYYYFVPDSEIRKLIVMCEKLYHQPPQAFVDTKTKIVAFGKVVPTIDAPALEASIR